MDSKLSAERNIFLENTYEQGVYIILIESYWSNNICNKFNLGSYSDHPVEMALLNDDIALYDSSEYHIWRNFV